MTVLVRSPSNIALIKYMGKIDSVKNLPANSSLSMTLSDLCTFVELKINLEVKTPALKFINELPLLPSEFKKRRPDLNCVMPDLSEAGMLKLTRFFDFALPEISKILVSFEIAISKIEHQVEMRSCNTFPEASGIASSASSFSALTFAIACLCAQNAKDFNKKFKLDSRLRLKLAQISRQGSGSSCRSFWGPWISWSGEEVCEYNLNSPKFVDLVVQVGEGKKLVGSSEAHKRVISSPLWIGRTTRAEERFKKIQPHLSGIQDFSSNLNLISDIVRDEFLDMHSLFHTSETPFSYWKPKSIEVISLFLNLTEEIVRRSPSKQKPILTMDAGPHLHWICLRDDAAFWRAYILKNCTQVKILEDEMGFGPELIEEVSQSKYHKDYFAKVVLSGEHTVLRGGSAVVIPNKDHKLSFCESENGKPVFKLFNSELLAKIKSSEVYRHNAVETDKKLLNLVEISSSIPSGAGLGSSAAYCLSIVEYLFPDFDHKKILDLARECEDVFHSKSSGMDIAAIFEASPICFSTTGYEKISGPNVDQVLSRFAVVDSGERSKTREAIDKVSQLRESNPNLAQSIDLQMTQASRLLAYHLGEMCLGSKDRVHEEAVSYAMMSAGSCFNQWGLVTDGMSKKTAEILNAGALAVKPTGSGLGGFLVVFTK